MPAVVQLLWSVVFAGSVLMVLATFPTGLWPCWLFAAGVALLELAEI